MPRLRTLRPRISTAPPRVSAAPPTAGTGFARTDGRSSTARGYGQDWRRFRLTVLADEPLCFVCAAEGRVTASTDVDHIIPFKGIDDPLRLDRKNVRSMCHHHHMQRTARQAAGIE